ncbi:hypothetical protein K7432_012792 [Basidiobolus ranarum]|uniref:Uncharacterized protein n=1 Tax=Basidiobolus ranarum TaxID=34480 RepID=A0ABR2WK96_9FUNG
MQSVFALLVSSCILIHTVLGVPVQSYEAIAPMEHGTISQEAVPETTVSEPEVREETPEIYERHEATPARLNVDLSHLQPKQALLEEVKGHASQGSQALSNSNQFDQAQLVDQTIYQPAQQPQPPIIIPQWALHRPRRAYKKYKKYGHSAFKIRYFSGNRRH